MRFGTRSEWREVGLELARVVTLANVVRGLGFVAASAVAVFTVHSGYGSLAALAALVAVSAGVDRLVELVEDHGPEALILVAALPLSAVGLLLIPVILTTAPATTILCAVAGIAMATLLFRQAGRR